MPQSILFIQVWDKIYQVLSDIIDYRHNGLDQHIQRMWTDRIRGVRYTYNGHMILKIYNDSAMNAPWNTTGIDNWRQVAMSWMVNAHLYVENNYLLSLLLGKVISSYYSLLLFPLIISFYYILLLFLLIISSYYFGWQTFPRQGVGMGRRHQLYISSEKWWLHSPMVSPNMGNQEKQSRCNFVKSY